MEAAAATLLQSPFGTFMISNSISGSVKLTANRTNFLSFHTNFGLSIKHKTSISSSKLGHSTISFRSRRFPLVRASLSSDSGSLDAPIAPLQLESPTGQFLSQILMSHPHLVPAAVEQQLEQLQTDREAEKREEPSAKCTDLVLYRRIAEVKANETRKALEEILYALVVQKFMDAVEELGSLEKSGISVIYGLISARL